jgi:hypothetical protein
MLIKLNHSGLIAGIAYRANVAVEISDDLVKALEKGTYEIIAETKQQAPKADKAIKHTANK